MNKYTFIIMTLAIILWTVIVNYIFGDLWWVLLVACFGAIVIGYLGFNVENYFKRKNHDKM